MQRRKFSREFKVETVRMTEERGVSVAQASRDSASLARETGRKSPSGKGPISETPLEVRKDAFGAFPFDVRKQLSTEVQEPTN